MSETIRISFKQRGLTKEQIVQLVEQGERGRSPICSRSNCLEV